MIEVLTIDLNKIKKELINSIRDAETIRQLTYYSIYINQDMDLLDRINPNFSLYGLYPHLGTISTVDKKYRL
jgi:hypothetical protein